MSLSFLVRYLNSSGHLFDMAGTVASINRNNTTQPHLSDSAAPTTPSKPIQKPRTHQALRIFAVIFFIIFAVFNVLVKHSEKGTVHPCPSLSATHFYGCTTPPFLYSARAQRACGRNQIDAISLCRLFVVRSALAQTCLPRFRYVFSNRERVLLP